MKSKNNFHLPISLIIISTFIASFAFVRFNSVAVSNALGGTLNKIAGNSNNKNLGNSKFISATSDINSMDNCGIDIKFNAAKVELAPGAQQPKSPNISRYTYKSIETKISGEEQKFGILDVACVDLNTTIKQLANSIDTANKADPTKITAFFGMPMEELKKLDPKSLYKLFLLKKAAPQEPGKVSECNELDKVSGVLSISSEVENRLDSKYIDCAKEEKDGSNIVTNSNKYKYIFDKESKFILQIGESNSDLFKVDNQFLLINQS